MSEQEIENDESGREIGIDNDNTQANLLDPNLVDFIQDTPYEDLLVEMDGSKGTGGDKMGLTSDWFSEKDDYRADTYLTPQQVLAATLLRNGDALPILKEMELQPFFDDLLDNLERYMLSVDGYAREQETNVLRAMFGDRGEVSQGDKDHMLMQMMHQSGDNPDE